MNVPEPREVEVTVRPVGCPTYYQVIRTHTVTDIITPKGGSVG